MLTFNEGDVVRWSVAFLADGRKRDPRWYRDQCQAIGIVKRVCDSGDLLVAWEGSHETCMHAPARIEHVKPETPVEVFRSPDCDKLPPEWRGGWIYSASDELGIVVRGPATGGHPIRINPRHVRLAV